MAADSVDVRSYDGLVRDFLGNAAGRTGNRDVKVYVKSCVKVVARDLSFSVFAGDKSILIADCICKGVGLEECAAIFIVKEGSSFAEAGKRRIAVPAASVLVGLYDEVVRCFFAEADGLDKGNSKGYALVASIGSSTVRIRYRTAQHALVARAAGDSFTVRVVREASE